MKVIQLHNRYRYQGGEEVVVEGITQLLRRKGINVSEVFKDSSEIGLGFGAKLGAFFSSIYSLKSYLLMRSIIKSEKPDIVHVHNIYPLFSPSILSACREGKVPIVMTCHNYRLVCPTGLLIWANRPCTKCIKGCEYWCLIRNCRGNLLESANYSLRNAFARKCRFFIDKINILIVMSEFQKKVLVNAGFTPNKIMLLPNMGVARTSSFNSYAKEYVAYVGRLSDEKGIDILLAAAKEMEGIPVKVAGDYSRNLKLISSAPNNVEFVGLLSRYDLRVFYEKARCLVLPSRWYEVFPMVVVEAMSHGVPAIVPKLGGLPEIVEDGVVGLTFDPGNVQDLTRKIIFLWNNPNVSCQMGLAARKKVMEKYSEDVFFDKLFSIYQKAIDMVKL